MNDSDFYGEPVENKEPDLKRLENQVRVRQGSDALLFYAIEVLGLEEPNDTEISSLIAALMLYADDLIFDAKEILYTAMVDYEKLKLPPL